MSDPIPCHPRSLARWGEDLAARFLVRRGWQVHARNVRTPYGEIDLVARDGRTWVFVEVKTRRGARWAWPEDAVTPAKLERLTQAALYWLEETGQPPDVPWRIDVVAIVARPGHRPEIRHFEGVSPDA